MSSGECAPPRSNVALWVYGKLIHRIVSGAGMSARRFE
jgi:hypothetical protein